MPDHELPAHVHIGGARGLLLQKSGQDWRWEYEKEKVFWNIFN